MTAGDLGAVYHIARLDSVASQERFVRISSGARLHYDTLILATGARNRRHSGALTFCDQRDLARLRHMLAELEAGMVSRVVFAVPAGCSWPLLLYELPLLSAKRAQERGLD